MAELDVFKEGFHSFASGVSISAGDFLDSRPEILRLIFVVSLVLLVNVVPMGIVLQELLLDVLVLLLDLRE